jgi:precorrin-4/cobalt-precorrin-4 C11-methyltransferase
VIHLGAQAIEEIAETVAPHYGDDCPAAIVARASWPDELVVRGTVGTIASLSREAGVKRTATIIIGRALDARDFRDSHLYSKARER